MLKNRSVAMALFIAIAALSTLLVASPAPAQDLESELEAKQSKLDEVREKKGVLTTTISHYADQIDRLTGAGRGRSAVARKRFAPGSRPSRPSSTRPSPTSTSPRAT